MFDSIWKPPPEELVLENDEVHVWLVSINSGSIFELEHIISNDERTRAARFHLSKHKTEYVASRIYLRMILGKYTGISPQLLRFEYNEYGKPTIADETNSHLKFNLSHSHRFALYAFTRDQEIGVDFELINPLTVSEEIAVKALTASELLLFKRLTTNERVEFFYKCWTRKEAYSKAIGKGLITYPNKIETLYLFDKPVVEPKINEIFSKTIDCSIVELPSINGFAASLAMEGSSKSNLKCWVSSHNGLAGGNVR